ncbi:MAG: monofunctional biosynthetic peptidoglycan transglycosylase [Gemmatimonadaceae bacterium]|nr:monofunctional biosynthetic peptidoglycan transglycosylase [Gemmatimonadaceae bacterium]
MRLPRSIFPRLMATGPKRTLFRRIRRLVVIATLAVIVGPFLLVLPLNLVQPFTTSVMLWRTAQRVSQGKRPVYPRRDIVSHDDISANLRRAVLASEDDRFYLHGGFDFEEIENALERAKRGRKLRGASTITQQVAKNIFLWEGRSYVRKGLEAWFAVVLELCLSKERILDLYLNLAEWGDGVFGAEMAAQTHFGKSAKGLTRDEAARLAAVLPSPRRWSPRGVIASRRAAGILARMRYAAPREEGVPPVKKR